MSKDDGRVISNFIVQALNGEKLTVYGDGEQTRSFCFVDDLVEGLILQFNSDYTEPINLGNPEEYKILALIDLISEQLQKPISIVHSDLPIDDPKKRKPDISRAKDILGWSPKISLEKGLEITIDWFNSIKINE